MSIKTKQECTNWVRDRIANHFGNAVEIWGEREHGFFVHHRESHIELHVCALDSDASEGNAAWVKKAKSKIVTSIDECDGNFYISHAIDVAQVRVCEIVMATFVDELCDNLDAQFRTEQVVFDSIVSVIRFLRYHDIDYV